MELLVEIPSYLAYKDEVVVGTVVLDGGCFLGERASNVPLMVAAPPPGLSRPLDGDKDLSGETSRAPPECVRPCVFGFESTQVLVLGEAGVAKAARTGEEEDGEAAATALLVLRALS